MLRPRVILAPSQRVSRGESSATLILRFSILNSATFGNKAAEAVAATERTGESECVRVCVFVYVHLFASSAAAAAHDELQLELAFTLPSLRS